MVIKNLGDFECKECGGEQGEYDLDEEKWYECYSCEGSGNTVWMEYQQQRNKDISLWEKYKGYFI